MIRLPFVVRVWPAAVLAVWGDGFTVAGALLGACSRRILR